MKFIPFTAMGLLLVSAVWLPPAAMAMDADAAQDLVKSNNCAKCHAPEKKKDGPSFKETAAKYKGKPIVREVSQGWHTHIGYAEDGTIVEIVVLDAKKEELLPLEFRKAA